MYIPVFLNFILYCKHFSIFLPPFAAYILITTFILPHKRTIVYLSNTFFFEISSKYCILDSFVDYDGYSISSKWFLPKVVDIMVIWVEFMLFIGFSRQEYWSGFPFPSPVDHVLSELSTMTHLSWVALHRIAHSFIELVKAVYCYPAYLTYMQSISWDTLAGWSTSWNQDCREKYQ